VAEVVVALAPNDVEHARRLVAGKVSTVVAGGATRRASVAAGLEALPLGGWVVVHDGARPFVSPALIERVLDAAGSTGAATAGLPVADTLKAVDGDQVRRTVDRRGLYVTCTAWSQTGRSCLGGS